MASDSEHSLLGVRSGKFDAMNIAAFGSHRMRAVWSAEVKMNWKLREKPAGNKTNQLPRGKGKAGNTDVARAACRRKMRAFEGI
jgi:hypothetical protein